MEGPSREERRAMRVIAPVASMVLLFGLVAGETSIKLARILDI